MRSSAAAARCPSPRPRLYWILHSSGGSRRRESVRTAEKFNSGPLQVSAGRRQNERESQSVASEMSQLMDSVKAPVRPPAAPGQLPSNGGRDETCPVSTGGGTRLVRLVREQVARCHQLVRPPAAPVAVHRARKPRSLMRAANDFMRLTTCDPPRRSLWSTRTSAWSSGTPCPRRSRGAHKPRARKPRAHKIPPAAPATAPSAAVSTPNPGRHGSRPAAAKSGCEGDAACPISTG